MTSSLDQLPTDLRSALQAELQPGEQVLWAAQPTPRELRRQSRGLAFVGLCFVGFGVFWIVATVREAMIYINVNAHHVPWGLLGFPLGGLPFLFLGLAMLTTPLWRGKGPVRIAYAVTDRRALLLHGEMLNRRIGVRSYLPAQIKSLHVVDRRDGGGDVVLDRVMVNAGRTKILTPVGFFGIGDAHEVEQLIRTRLLAGAPPSHVSG